jgi:hypothetical protein
MMMPPLSLRGCAKTLLAIAWAAGIPACGDAPVTEIQSPIIGGSSVSIASQRSIGVVTVNDACSGAVIAPNWVITATHCLNWSTASANTVTCPRADMTTLERRTVAAMSQVGPSDVTLLQLASTSTTWPNVSRTTWPFVPQLGTAINCYGRGATQYATGGGFTGTMGYRVLNAHVDNIVNGNFVMNATGSGSEAFAPGDSGGACFLTGQIAGVASFADVATCADPTNETTCAQTVTRLASSDVRSIQEFAAYIDNAASRAGTATFGEIGTPDGHFNFVLPNGWVNHPYGTDDAKAALNQNTVHLRGAVQAGSSADLFQLPSTMRPSGNVFIPITLCDAAKGRLYVNTQGWVQVQEEGAEFWRAQCFTSLDGASFAINSTGATPLTFLPGWTNTPYNTRAPAVRVVDGVVRFQGAVSGNGTSSSPFNVPSGFRPFGRTVYLPVDLCNAAKGRISIDVDGNVLISPYGSFGDAQCFTSLEGLAYPTNAGSALALLNGWTNADPSMHTNSPTVINVGGIVRLGGAMKTTGTNAVAFRLPANMRPATAVYATVSLSLGMEGRLLIQPDGYVQVQVPAGQTFGFAQAFTSLEGVSFGL